MNRWDVKIDKVVTQSRIGLVFVQLSYNCGSVIAYGVTMDEALDKAETDIGAAIISVLPEVAP